MVGTYNFQFSLLLVNYDQHPPSHCSKIVNLPVIPGPTVLRNHVCWMLHPFSNSLWPIAHPLSKLMKKTYVMQLSDWQKGQEWQAHVEKETRVLGRYELVEAVMETRTGPRPSIISFLMVHQLSIGDCRPVITMSHNDNLRPVFHMFPRDRCWHWAPDIRLLLLLLFWPRLPHYIKLIVRNLQRFEPWQIFLIVVVFMEFQCNRDLKILWFL